MHAMNQTPQVDASLVHIRQAIKNAGKPYGGGIRLTAILPEDGLYIWDWGDIKGDKQVWTPKKITAKFIRAFRTTWARLPEKDRLTLLTHWHRHDKPGQRKDKPSPSIEFNSFSLPRYQVASCGYGGSGLRFSVRHVEYAKPATLQHTIAHELGHAISYPHGWAGHHDCEMEPGGECAACECQAFSYMAHWGFDPFFGRLPAGRTIVDRCSKAQER